jgi:predicted DNA binding CopG/RHH family protein
MNKKKNYTLRLNPTDVNNIKSMALQKGLPYQTFISSILHQVATKQIKV